MRRLVAALAIFLGLASAALAQTVGPAPIVCNKTYIVSQAATALTKIVTNTATQQISICGWALNAGAATATAQLKSGTGTNCGTNTASVTPEIDLGINGTYIDHTPYASTSLARSTDLCLVTTGTGPMAVTVYYGQY